MVSYKVSEAKKAKARKEAQINAEFNSKKKICFPNCIGMFPECVGYTEQMTEEQRSECRSCPYKGKRK